MPLDHILQNQLRDIVGAKAAIADTQSQAHAAMNVKDVQELMALQAGYLQPLSEKAVAFSRHVYEIASTTSKEFGEAVEGKAAEAQKLTAQDLLTLGVIDEIIAEPIGGAQRFPTQVVESVRRQIEIVLNELMRNSGQQLKQMRREKFLHMGKKGLN